MKITPIRPNAGIRAAYQKKLEAAVEDMHRSLTYWIKAKYRSEMAMDATAAQEIRRLMRRYARRWQSKFTTLSGELAAYFATSVNDRVDGALSDMFRRGGFTVKFRMTAAQREAVQAVIGENVPLIKSIASKHIADVEGIVMRSVAAGRDLATLAGELEHAYGVTKARAALIARHQNNTATAHLLRARHIELGVKEARWLHSSGGRKPRPEHVAFSGKTYEIAKGAYLEGRWTWPGVEINCRCVSVPIIPGFES